MPHQFAAVDDLAASFQRRGGQPGVAYGIVAGGELVHSGGSGERWLGGPTPDAGTVFRIASMTKSFTAAAVLALRDEGRLALDDPAEPRLTAGLPPAPAHHDGRVPDRRSVGGPAAGAAAGRVRRLPGPRPELRLGTRDPVRVLQSRLCDPRPGHHRGHRPALCRVRSGPAAPAARAD